jgi:hypothetical protein
MIIDINTFQQFSFLYKRSKKIILIFYREGNNASRDIIRLFNKLSKDDKYIDINFIGVEFDLFNEIADQFNIDKPPIVCYLYEQNIVNIVYDNNLGLIEDYLDELFLL